MNFTRRVKYLIFPLFIGLFFMIDIQAAGEVDLGFNASAQFKANGPVHKIVSQSDGKLLVGGSYTVFNGSAVNSIVRLNADGSLDTSFNAPLLLKLTTVYSFGIQPDGKILVGLTANVIAPEVVRLNTDGSLDTTFNNIDFQTGNIPTDIEILPDGKFLVAGSIIYQETYRYLIKFNADGTRYNSFIYNYTANGFVNDVEVMPDGRLLAGGRNSQNNNGFLLRLNADGSNDASFPAVTLNGYVTRVKLQSDGKIIFTGAFQSVNGQTKSGIARINADGSFDATFNPSNGGANSDVNEMVFAPDGKILIGGGFTQYNNVSRSRMARLNADGSLDPSFTANLGGDAIVQSIGFLPNNKILVGYSAIPINPSLPRGLFALNSDGSFDSTLTYYTSRTALIRKVVEQPDGRIIVAGNFDIVNNTPRVDLARLNIDGSLDPSFNPVSDTGEVVTIALQPDGKLLIGLYNNTSIRLKRLNADGSLDTSFNLGVPDPILINEIAVLPNGKILIGGGFTVINRAVVRLNADGSIDNTFDLPENTSINTVNKILVEPDGRLLIGRNNTIRRYTADGALDGTFNTNLNSAVFDLARLPDGRVIAAGIFSSVNGNTSKRYIVRLTPDGVLDTTFTASVDAYVARIQIQSDRKIVIGGQFAFVNGVFRTGLARLSADGALDSSFTANANDVVSDFILSNNKIIASGIFTNINGTPRINIARLNNNIIPPRAPFDFDGDGRTDIVVYRPSNSVWYQLLGQNYQFSSVTFGLSDDVLAPADYDGDGKTDLGIYRPSTGVFWYRSTAQNNAFRAVQWGQSGDIPLPSDFNGDGKADYVVYRPSNNTWYRLADNQTSSIITFGIAGDKPVIGDFDGDGKADPAVFRPSTGVWWYAASSQNNTFRAVQFGANGDIPAAGDFDGDSKTDMAVYRPSNGAWYILNSANNSVTILGFGLNGDKPVVGDYDGDGKADISVYRPTNGVWYLYRSSAGYTGIQLGTSTDLPLPNSFTGQ